MTGQNLAVVAAGTVDLSQVASIVAGSFAAKDTTAGAAVKLFDASGFTVGSVAGDATFIGATGVVTNNGPAELVSTATETLSAGISTGNGNTLINSGGAVIQKPGDINAIIASQNLGIVVNALLVNALVDLGEVQNNVPGSLAIQDNAPGASVQFADANGFAVGNVAGDPGFAAGAAGLITNNGSATLSSSSGSILFSLSTNVGTGNFTASAGGLLVNAPITSTSGDVTFETDSLQVNSEISGNSANLLPQSQNAPIVFAPGPQGPLGLAYSSFHNFGVGKVRVGSTTAGDIEFLEPVNFTNLDPHINTLSLITGGNVTDADKYLETVSSLAIQAPNGSIGADSNHPLATAVGTIAYAVKGQAFITYNGSGTGLNLGSVDGVSGINSSGPVTLVEAGPITFASPLNVAGDMTVTATGAVTFQANVTVGGNLTVTAQGASSGTIGIGNGIAVKSTGGNVMFQAADALTLVNGSVVQATAAGKNLTLAGGTVALGGTVSAPGAIGISGSGSLNIAGTITGASVTVTAGPGADTIILDLGSGSNSSLTATGGDGADHFNVTPSAGTEYVIHGGNPAPPAVGSDTLTIGFAGTTNPLLTPAENGFPGQWTFGNRQPVVFDGIEQVKGQNMFAREVTGAGTGGGPHVEVFDPGSNTPVNQFFAYSSTFTGGVRVALGKINGDATPDIITAPGPGGGPDIRVFDGANPTKMIAEFAAYSSNVTFGVYVAAGDVNGDGIDDIITGADMGGGPQVKVFDGASLLAGKVKTLDSFFAYGGGFTGGVRVAAGDVNDDGFADIITGAGPGGGPNVRVYSVATGMPTMIRNFNAYTSSFSGGVYVAAGDVNGDGFADIVTGPGSGGGPRVEVFSGADVTSTTKLFRQIRLQRPHGYWGSIRCCS